MTTRLPGIVEASVIDNDDWYTPPHIIKALRVPFDTDPCSPVGGVPWINAVTTYTEADDGLVQPWFGHVWLNPPYSNPTPWVNRLFDHGDGIALLQCDTSTRLFHETIEDASAICFLRGRVKFYNSRFEQGDPARFASMLLAFGDECGAAVKSSRLGRLVQVIPDDPKEKVNED